MDEKPVIREIHLGGGTPTFFSPENLYYLIYGLLEGAHVHDKAEFSFEAHPANTTPAHLKTLYDLGFRRLSLGIQDFDPKVQNIVNRVQSVAQVQAVTEQARAAGFSSVNFDLIYGLPLQTLSSIDGTMDAVCGLRPDRIALYGYAHVPWIRPGQRRFTDSDVPEGAARRALYERGRERLEQAGYREIGLDHFALPSDSLWQAAQAGSLHRNFMGYTDRLALPLLGLGVSAIGDSGDGYAQNEKDLQQYHERLARGELPIHRGHLLDAEDLVLRRHVLSLMTRMETDWSGAGYTPFLDDIGARMAEFAADGLVELSARSCRVTAAGRGFLRNICMAFDARLSRRSPERQLFSRTA